MKSHRNHSIWLAILCCIGSMGGAAQELQITLRQAVDQALQQNPEASVAHASDKEASADARLTRTKLLPKLTFTEDISRGNDPVYAFGTRLRQQKFTQADFALNALNRPQPIGNFASRFTASWTAFDSFKTQWEIRRADLLKKRSASSAAAVDQQIVLDVVRAYQSVLYAQREIEVAGHEQATATALLNSVDERVKAGLAVESDRMLAQVNVAARQEELIAAQGDLEMAKAELCETMGAPQVEIPGVKALEPRAYPQLPLQQELDTAAKMRPNLKAMGQAQSAQAAGVRAARAEYGPRVNAYGNWEDDRSSLGGARGNSWVAGVQISVDIFPASKPAQLAKESAAKLMIDAQQAVSAQHVRLEVSRAHIHRQTAALTVETARAAKEQSAESLRIVRNRYNSGLATITDLLRAEDAERESQSRYWKAVNDNAVTYAELLYATGTLTPDATEELQ